jgi:hypothetical protein
MEHLYYEAGSVIYQIITAAIRAMVLPEKLVAEAPGKGNRERCLAFAGRVRWRSRVGPNLRPAERQRGTMAQLKAIPVARSILWCKGNARVQTALTHYEYDKE